MRRTSDVATADAYNRPSDLADLHELLPGVRVPTLITVAAMGPARLATSRPSFPERGRRLRGRRLHAVLRRGADHRRAPGLHG
ncbi:MAG: hypothetical protein M5T61_09430 [Acidimicrobiia bacterium]|nr:hypothetical protein [Acidimicrobiia bacterium]